jgi:hypothetical protein
MGTGTDPGLKKQGKRIKTMTDKQHKKAPSTGIISVKKDYRMEKMC